MSRRRRSGLHRLPDLVEQKLTKTGYTRGASTKEIYQNRVSRNNPVLIPWEFWQECKVPNDGTKAYENGFIVLLEPEWYFGADETDEQLKAEGIELGVNALLIFRKRSDWLQHAPDDGYLPNGKPFTVATSRSNPLGGTYFARIHATVSAGVEQIVEGFNSNTLRGAGIRVYEYASARTILAAKVQLEALMWLCHDSHKVMQSAGMSWHDVIHRRTFTLLAAEKGGLLDYDRLGTLRMIDSAHTICPLCRERISAADFLRRTEQAEGRAVYDLTTTDVSLFHIQELRIGKLQHKPYNLGWGHHHCNVVVKDSGIMPTLKWMTDVLANQLADESLEAETESVEKAVEG